MPIFLSRIVVCHLTFLLVSNQWPYDPRSLKSISIETSIGLWTKASSNSACGMKYRWNCKLWSTCDIAAMKLGMKVLNRIILPRSTLVVCSWIRIFLKKGTLKEETFAVQKNRKIFTFRGNKLSRMKSYETFRGNKLSRWTTFKRFYRNKKSRNSKFVRKNIRFYCTVIKVGTWPVLKSLKKSLKNLFSTILSFLSS